ncbi:MAG: pyridoxal-phosphate dependent enzyme [Dermatophilaceae bacterium]
MFLRRDHYYFQEHYVDLYLDPAEVNTRIPLQAIFFQQSKAIILESSYPELNRLFTVLTDNPNLQIRIEGHTDNIGKAEDLFQLSEERAAAIRDFSSTKRYCVPSPGHCRSWPKVPADGQQQRCPASEEPTRGNCNYQKNIVIRSLARTPCLPCRTIYDTLNTISQHKRIQQMQFYSTNNPALRASLKEAIFKGLPDDNGLFMPVEIPGLSDHFLQHLTDYSFQEIAFEITRNLLHQDIPEKEIRRIVETAIDFPAPAVKLDDDTYILELFHGPSLAFKDFGARFMAQTMAYFNQHEEKELVILVATSGDTGGAVAAGFYKTPGIQVVILYPFRKSQSAYRKNNSPPWGTISPHWKWTAPLTTARHWSKRRFSDKEVNQPIRLSSANSINIARLIPQSFYYFEAYKQVAGQGKPVVFSIPSGNFGNLTAGLVGSKNGACPSHHFIAATNANDVVPEYLTSGAFTPRPSQRTLSNAMDVGAPSNFARMLDLYCSTWNNMRHDISGFGFTDTETKVSHAGNKAAIQLHH